MPRRLTRETLRAAWWTLRALRQARRGLRRGRLETVRLSAPPRLSDAATRGVLAVLRRRPSSCLERALVLQRWYAAHGAPRDVVVGVVGPAESFRAHAWLDGEPMGDASYQELMRVPVA